MTIDRSKYRARGKSIPATAVVLPALGKPWFRRFLRASDDLDERRATFPASPDQRANPLARVHESLRCLPLPEALGVPIRSISTSRCKPCMRSPPTRILPTIVLSQFTGTSLWFAANAVMPDLQRRWGLPPEALGDVTAAVQLGFIAGTLAFAVLAVSDRYSPGSIFLSCSVLGALANAAAYLIGPNLQALLGLRFTTGFLLAGIYPVGMKIAAGWYQRDLGRALGFLVGRRCSARRFHTSSEASARHCRGKV